MEDGFFGAVVAVFGFVFALHDGEGVQDVADGMAGRGEGAGEGFGLLLPLGLGAEVEVEEGGVQLAPQQEAPLLVPPERRPTPSAGRREGLQDLPLCRSILRPLELLNQGRYFRPVIY